MNGNAARPAKEAVETSFQLIPSAYAEEVEALVFAPQVTQVPSIDLSGYPDPEKVSKATGEALYKIQRLQEMASLWKGTDLEPHTVRLLAMLLTENGALTAELRHDCNNIYSKRLGRKLKGCFAVGIMGHNIAARGTPLVALDHGKPWKLYDYDYGMTDFEKDYPAFSTEWRIQFAEYTKRMQILIFDEGRSVSSAIQSWNPGEAGRIGKVQGNEWLVKKALGY